MNATRTAVPLLKAGRYGRLVSHIQGITLGEIVMSRSAQLVLLHVCLVAIVLLWIWSVKGRFDDLTFDARKRMGRLFLPGRLKNRESWVKQQRTMAHAGLVFALTVYLITLVKILR